MVTNVKGTFDKVTGTVEIDDAKLENSKLNIEIDPSSINTKNEQRDGHLKSADGFFDVAKFPKMTFVSKKVKDEGKGNLSVTGDLTMHGVTKEVVLAVTDLTKETKDAFVGKLHRCATATAKLNRKDFGLTWNKALEAGGVTVGEEVTVNIEVELVKHEAEKAPEKKDEKKDAKAK